MTSSIAELRALLAERFPQTRAPVLPEYELVSSGIGTLDALVGGGLRPGSVTVLSGGMSSGKTSLALAFAAHLSRKRSGVAWLHNGAFSAPSAAHGGLDLDFLLQVQVQSMAQSQRCLDILLREAAFPLVVTDWPWSCDGGSSWQRIRTLLAGSRSALLVLCPPLPETATLRFLAAIHLHVVRPWPEDPRVELIEVFLQKSRFAAPGGSIQLSYGNACGPFALCAETPGLGQEWNTEG